MTRALQGVYNRSHVINMTKHYTQLIYNITTSAHEAFPDSLPDSLNETIEAAIVCLAHKKYLAVDYLLNWCKDFLSI